MIEKAFHGGRAYRGWLALLAVVAAAGFLFYRRQLGYGLGITGMSRDVTWGFYIAQFTFLVGVAASAVMVVLPCYLHDYKAFGRITVLGEFLAVGCVLLCILFVFVDLGQPWRVMNVFLYPSPRSVMFWDMIVLSGYFLLNLTVGWAALKAEAQGLHPPAWTKPLVYLSIPWAVSIHTVTAFLYSGLAARHFWHTAILAPRFLASAFASGPALLLLLCLIVRRTTKFDPGREAIQKLAQIVAYAMCLNVFFVGLEFFTVYYGQVPGEIDSLRFLFFGLDGHGSLVPLMWTAAALAAVGIALLVVPRARHSEPLAAVAAVAVFVACWIDKGIGLMVAGFTPTPFHAVTDYAPSGPELVITAGVYAVGALVITLLFKIAIGVKEGAES